jgi:hypothetical protein
MGGDRPQIEMHTRRSLSPGAVLSLSALARVEGRVVEVIHLLASGRPPPVLQWK